jgi:hypothetical protein
MYRTRTCIEEKKKANAGPNKIKVIYDDYTFSKMLFFNQDADEFEITIQAEFKIVLKFY